MSLKYLLTGGILAFVAFAIVSPVFSAEADLGVARVRQVPAINGGATVDGSIHMMTGAAVVLNGGATITRDLLVPGVPVVRVNGKPGYGGTLDGSGPAAPSNYTITLNGGAALRNVIRRTAPLALPVVSPPPAPSGTRNVTLGSATQPVGDWATLRGLTLNGNAGQIAVPPGTYGDFVANGGSGFTLGIAGATTPAVYDLQRLTINGQARIDVVGPVVLNLANGLAANGALGSVSRPDWLALNIAAGGLTLNGGCTIHAFVNAPAAGSGTVIINGNSTLVGGLVADQLIVNGGGLLRLRQGGGAGPVNTAPVANSQSLSTSEDTPLALTLTATDAENDALVYRLVSLPDAEAGTLFLADGMPLPALGSVLASTALRYEPKADSTEPVSFTFRVRDAAGLESNLATVSIAVTPVNDVPAAAPLVVRTDEDMPVELLLSGTDSDGTVVSYAVKMVTSEGAALQGSLTGEPPALTYRPKADFFGEETFTYTVTDDQGGVSAEASVTIIVRPINDAPVPRPQSIDLSEDESILITLGATDAENQSLSYALSSLPAAGYLRFADGSALPTSPLGELLPIEAGGVLRYTPYANRHGSDVFGFTATDGEAVSGSAAIHLTIMPVNDTPVAAPGGAGTSEEAAVVITLSATDIDGDTLGYEIATPPEHGTVSLAGNLATYTPCADYHGVDSFTFTAFDQTSVSAPASVHIEVASVNDAPTAAPVAVQATSEDTVRLITFHGADVDGDPLVLKFAALPAHGTLTLVDGGAIPVDGAALPVEGLVLRYTPAADYHGADGFEFFVSDSSSAVSAVLGVSVVVSPVNDVPRAIPKRVSTPEDSPLTIILSGLDADEEPLAFVLAALPSHGALSLSDGTILSAPGLPLPAGTSSVRYAPSKDFNGFDTFGFMVSDPSGATSSPASVGITVVAGDDAPVAHGASLSATPGVAAELGLSATDPDGDALTYALAGAPLHGTAVIVGSVLKYTATPGYSGFDVVGFQASDGSLSSEVASVLVTVRAPDAPPIVYAGGEQTVWVIDGADGRVGTIVVNNDEWTLSDSGFGNAPTAANFALNLANWFKRGAGTKAKLLVYSNNFGLTGARLSSTMRGAGHEWTIRSSGTLTLSDLLPYDAVFLCGLPAAAATLDSYVNEGGSIYLCGQGYGQDQTWWNTFLAGYGLRFGPANPVVATVPVSSSHPLLAGVKSLFYYNGNDVQLLATPNVTNNEILHKTGPYNLLSAYTTGRFVANLSGSLLTEGPGGAVTFAWSFVEGPGLVRFEDSAALHTRAYFSTAGTYRLRLTATSATGASSSAESLLHLRLNVPPLIDAGPDLQAVAGATVPLAGSAQDDGNPSPTAGLKVRWTQTEGPAPVTIADAGQAATTAVFPVAGTYRLVLAADDSELSSSDTVTVTVSATAKVNAAPVVGLATPQRIQIGGALSLSGSVSDDGLPSPGALTCQWLYISGPAAPSFQSSTSPQTSVTFPVVGQYLLRLTASDGAFQGSADVVVEVLPADVPVGNQAPAMTLQVPSVIYVGQAANFTVAATDDGLPVGSSLGYSWTKVLGDGSVAFTTPAAFTTSAVFSAAGRYVIRVSVSDGDRTSFIDYGLDAVFPAQPTNLAPTVSLPASATAGLKVPVALTAVVADDGLPSPPASLSYRWQKMSGPGNVTVSNPGSSSITATFHATGDYVLRLLADDGKLTGFADIAVSVSMPADPKPPTVSVFEPLNGFVFPGDAFEIAAHASDPEGSIIKVEFFVDGIAVGSQTLPSADEPDTYFWRLTGGLSEGTHTLTARATNHLGITAVSAPFAVISMGEPPPSAVEVAEIHSPLDGARISAPTDFTGVVVRTGLVSWKLEYRLTPPDPAASAAAAPWTAFAGGTEPVGTPANAGSGVAAVPGVLGVFDPTLLLNGLYQVRLSATSANGTKLIDGPVGVLVEGGMKVGAFSVAFNDLVEQTPGLPVTLTRTYDSRDRRVGDFGPGWNLSLGNVRVQKNRDLGAAWWQTPQFGNGIQFYDVLPVDERLVTIVMPDGETHRFRAGAYVKNRVGDPEYRSFATVVRQGSYRFYPVGDTTSTLEPITFDASGEPILADRFWLEGTDDQDLYAGHYGDGDDFGFPEPYNPTQFRLTTADGTVILLDQALGLLELRDRNGNRLVVNRHPASAGAALAGRVDSVDSIQAHEAGPITRTIEIHRRPDGRVDYITDLAGRTLDYLYDPQGRLASFTDRENNTTQFRYEKSDGPAHPLFHYLTKIIDPRGLPALRCEYDGDGRLTKQVDADGKETVFDRGIDPGFGRYERITDRLGHPTTYFYDERGNIRTKIDALNAVTSYDYYPDSDRVKFEEDHYGNVKGFAYDARGNVTVEILGASRSEQPATAVTGYITRTSYTAFGAPLSITDPDGRVQSFTYDPVTQQLLTHTVGQLVVGAHPEIEAATPATTTYTYHPDGTLWTVVDALGNITTTTYDYGFSDAVFPGAVKRVVTTVVDPAGAPGSDPANAAAITLRTTYAYHDVQDNLLATVTPRTLAEGGVESIPTRHVYDAENRLRFTVLPDGRISETRYTSFGQTEKTLEWPVGTDLAALVAAGPSGPTAGARVTSFAYDDRGNLERTTLPDGTYTTTGYDLESRPFWRQDARGHRTFTVYDEVGRPRFTIQPDSDDGTFDDAPAGVDDPRLANNPRSETIYDLVGRVRFQIDEEGATTEFTYDDHCGCAMRRKEMIQHHPDGNLVTSYAYYPSGQIRAVTDPRGHTTGTRYDSHGRPVRTLLPATDEHPATEIVTTYNVLGQRVAAADQEGKLARYRHDGLGRLLEVRQYLDQSLVAPDSAFTLPVSAAGVVSTRYAYDEAGNQTAQIDARDHITRYEHDPLGRRLKRTLPSTDGAAKFERLRYDRWGDLWQRDDFAGRTTTFGYDELHRITSKRADVAHPSLVYSHAIARVEYDYDESGARDAARTYNASGQLLYVESTPRDERGRLDYKETADAVLDYDYHANGLLKDIVSSAAGGVNLGYRYDELNRLAYVDDASRGLPVRTTSYAYDANGSLAAFTYANGLRHAYRYDALNRLRHLDVGAGPVLGTTVTAVAQSYDYRLRAGGHRREVVETGTTAATRTVAYGYDELYRLAGETISGDPLHSGAVGYTLDKVGNREARTSSVPDLGTVTGVTFNARDQLSTDSYDANGNTLLGRSTGPAPAAPDVYDFEDRLIVRTRADLSKVCLAYDADGIRVRKTILDASSQLVSTTGYLICTNNLTGYAQVLEERKSDAGGTTLKTYVYGHDLLSVSESSDFASGFTARYFAYDGGGSVRALADENGAITDRYTYDAFGVLLAHQGASDNAYLYRGEQYDADLGLTYLRARFYAEDSGRFWNQDTYEGSNTDPASLHKYLYAHADPVNGFDPSGNLTLTEMMQAVQSVGILARIAVPAITRIGFSVAHRLAAAALRPLFVFAGGLPIATQMGQRLSVFDRFMRFFITPTQGYAPVAPWLKDMFQMMGVRLQQGHVFIQQAWYRAGSPNQWYPGDTAANLGMQRLANAGFNLLAMPGGLNRALGANNLQGSIGTTVFAGGVVAGTAGSIAWALENLWDLISGPEADEEPPPATP